MDLAYLCETLGRKPLRRANERGPQSSMNEGNLAVDETTHQDIAALPDGPRDGKDLVTLRMRPPPATNRTPDDRVSQRRDRTSR
jgi:hypothetical protein